jgi:hypothetical protein
LCDRSIGGQTEVGQVMVRLADAGCRAFATDQHHFGEIEIRLGRSVTAENFGSRTCVSGQRNDWKRGICQRGRQPFVGNRCASDAFILDAEHVAGKPASRLGNRKARVRHCVSALHRFGTKRRPVMWELVVLLGTSLRSGQHAACDKNVSARSNYNAAIQEACEPGKLRTCLGT